MQTDCTISVNIRDDSAWVVYVKWRVCYGHCTYVEWELCFSAYYSLLMYDTQMQVKTGNLVNCQLETKPPD